MERQILDLQGDTAALRRLDLQALDKSNRALLRRIHRLQDEARAAEEAAREVERIASERNSLEEQWLRLTGQEDELRRRQLGQLHESNRALQMMIWGLEDARRAMEALEPRDFATLVDFRRAQARAASGGFSAGAPASGAHVYQPTQNAAGGDGVIELRRLREEQVRTRGELAGFRDDHKQLGVRLDRHTKATADILRLFDREGMPAVRDAS